MTIGDGRHFRQPPELFPNEYYPEGTAVPTVLRGALEGAYSYAQFGGRHIGTWVQDVDLNVNVNFALHVTSATLTCASFRAYIAEHHDLVGAHVVWYGPGAPRFRIRVNAVNGAWQTPDEDAIVDWPESELAPGLPPLREYVFSEPLQTLLPATYTVEVQAEGANGASVVFAPYLVSTWLEVERG